MTDKPAVLRPKQLGKLPIRSAEDRSWLSGLIYGQSGIGKTVLAGSAGLVEEMCPVLVLDAEAGTMSLSGKYGSDNVDVVDVKTYQDYADIHRGLKVGDIVYKTLIIDSLTEMAMQGLEEIVARAVRTTATQQNPREHDPEQPEQADWYKNNLRIHKIIRYFRALPCHTFFIALETTDVTRPTKPMIAPAFNTKRLSGEIPGAVDEVWYMYKREAEDKKIHRFLLTDATDKIIAKDRSQKLPKIIMDPTMQEIWDYFTGAKIKDA